MAPRVIVVDDEIRIADTLAMILGQAGYHTNAAYDGNSAVDLCRKFSPELLITDVVMPGMNGIELSIAVKTQQPGCKILLVSGQAATSEMLACARDRGYDFELVSKPIHPQNLLAKIAELLGPAETADRVDPVQRDQVA